MSGSVGPKHVPKDDEEALQELLDEIEEEVRDLWHGEWKSKDAQVEAFIVDAY